jgi:hypothetical protein
VALQAVDQVRDGFARASPACAFNVVSMSWQEIRGSSNGRRSG